MTTNDGPMFWHCESLIRVIKSHFEEVSGNIVTQALSLLWIGRSCNMRKCMNSFKTNVQ